MRYPILASLALAAAATAAGCYTTRIVAPANSAVALASDQQLCTEAASNRVHYLLWGLVSVGDDTSASEAAAASGGGVYPVRVSTEQDFVDGLLRFIGTFLTLGIYAGSASIDVERCGL